MEQLEKYVKRLANVSLALSLVVLAALMFMTAFDVLGRYVGYPITGAYQLSEIMEVWIICLAWPITELARGHIEMDIVFSRLSASQQRRIEVFDNLAVLGIFSLVTWQGMALVQRNYELGELIPIIQIPLYPFQLIIPLAAAANCLVLLVRLAGLLRKRPAVRQSEPLHEH